MGSSESKQLEPDELLLFKTVPDVSDIEIPERAKNRVRTDGKFLIVFGVVAILFLPFLIYTLVYADVDRYGIYDACGNICGKNNSKYEQWPCTGKDFTNKRLIQFDHSDKSDEKMKCVSRCSPGYEPELSVCMKAKNPILSRNDSEHSVEFEEEVSVSNYLQSVAWRLTLACFVSLGIALSMLYLFRTATAAMVWSILVAVLWSLVIGVGFLWYAYSSDTEKSEKWGGLFVCLFFTAVLAILVIVIIFLFKKIAMVIALFREAMKATFAMPLLLLIPIVSFFVELILAVVFLTLVYYLGSAGRLTELKWGNLEYESDVFMDITMWFNFWMFFWTAKIITGLQYMVIAGAVAQWYFARDKNNLGSPIMTSARTAFKFHLGTVVFGSMVITIIAIIRSILTSLTKNRIVKPCIGTCVGIVERFLKYLSKNAYILTAMHGKPFFKSGKRAAKIIFSNAADLVAHNYIGDFILFMAHLLVVLLSLFFVYLILPDSPHQWVVYLIVAVVSLIEACLCFSIMETVIDTIFLCFCEDKLLNDGMARPYAMSRGLMEFMEDSRKVFGDKRGP